MHCKSKVEIKDTVSTCERSQRLLKFAFGFAEIVSERVSFVEHLRRSVLCIWGLEF